MAEVATKKSINVVSNNKKSEVCSVQSNNGLIDLDNLTASNNQLITLCDHNDDDDDLILTNNSRNELDTEDKSLQELIESELALRICSSNEDDTVVESEDQDEARNQPETVKKILLERRQDPLDINAEFIIAETEHGSLIEEPYSYQNGHASPETKTADTYSESVKPDPITVDFRNEESVTEPPEVGSTMIIQETTNDDIDQTTRDANDDNEDPCPDYREVSESVEKPEELLNLANVSESAKGSVDESEEKIFTKPVARVDKYQQEEEVPGKIVDVSGDFMQTDVASMEAEDPRKDTLDTWSEQFSVDRQAGQFSDDRQADQFCVDRQADHFSEDRQTGQFSVDRQADQFSEDRQADQFSGDRQAGQFSDNFDETVCQETCDSRTENEKPVRLTSDNDINESCKEYQQANSESDDKNASLENKATEVIPDSLSNEGDEKRAEEKIGSKVNAGTGNYEDGSLSQSEVASTQDFLDMERRVLREEEALESISRGKMVEKNLMEDENVKDEVNDNIDEQNVIVESSSELSVSESTFIEKTEVIVSENTVTIFSETKCIGVVNDLETTEDVQGQNLDSWTTVEEATKMVEERVTENTDREESTGNVTEVTASDEKKRAELIVPSSPRAPLATPDDEISDVSNACDSESREETITTSSSVVSSSNVKSGTKTKKKKIEGVSGNDASPNLTPRTKKTKKSKKSDLEKENISVNSNLQDASMHTGPRELHPEMIDFSNEDDLSNVNVKSLTQNYVSEATRNEQERFCKERIATGVSIKQLCRSFGDISNMGDGDQTGFGKMNNSMDTDEKARSMGDLRVCEKGYSKFTKDALVFTGVSVKALRASYCSLANLSNEGKSKDRPITEKSSFNKFDALSKKTVLHVRSVDAGKVQQQLNAVGQNGDTNPNCRSCGKVVFQMEQTKAEGLVWHKNCFRCVQCSKQLNVDNYESHESTLYCKPHFKELFQPKPVEESDQPASDKPDLGLEELSSLNVKSRFQVFEKAGTETTNEIERSPSQIAVKRSPSILSKLAKFQAKGMDIGVADESLNGIPFEESSESEEEEEIEETEDVDTEIVKAKRATRERPISFSKMDDIKNRWETTSQQGRREVQREARKEEIAGIRSRLFMGKQGKMKEMYQQAVAGSERVTKINAAEEIQHSTHARSIKERFERGEPIAASDDETDGKPKPEKADEEVIAAGISRKSRSLFLELDATAAKTGRPVTPVNPKTPVEGPRRARDAFMGRQVSDDVVRSSDTTEEVQVETSDISNKFKFFESYKEPEKQRKQFRITPPRDGQIKVDSPEREIYRDPDVVRAEDRVNEVVHTDTARKMLSIFRQMEENACKKELPHGPKPLKRFTPPPEDKYAKPTASDSEEDEEEDAEDSEGEDSNEERDPNYVRASDKVEDEFLKQAQNAARAKTLCAKFEHWDESDGKVTSSQNIAEMEMAQGTGEQSSIESASSLRARFESLGSQPTDSPRTPKVKVNRFVEIQTSCMDVCESCEKKVYPLEKIETNNKIFHKQCFRCLQCNCILRMDTFTLNNGKLYCIPHFKQLFITRGNYDEGFGVDPHKNKWSTTNTNNTASPAAIAVSNGDL